MKKKIFATLVAFALVAISASAQEVRIISNGERTVTVYQNIDNNKILSLLESGVAIVNVSIGQPVVEGGLTKHPVRQYWLADGKSYSSKDILITEGSSIDENLASEYHKKSVDTRFVESLYDDKERDVYYYQVEYGKKTYKIVEASCNKHGWAFGLYAGYEKFQSVNSPIAGVSAQFSQPYYMVELTAEGGFTEYSSNAEKAGEKYFNYRTGLVAGFTVPRLFDKYDLNRLYLIGGLKYKWFATDSPKGEDGSLLKSEGNLLSPVVGLRYERRLFAKGHSFYLQVTAEQDRAIIQNMDDATNWGVICKLGFNFGAGRNKIKNK
jgi:hypothetical protein